MAPAHLLAPCLVVLFNAAFTTGQVPQSWKTSLVTPVFKHGDATDTANYRPISVGEPISRLCANIMVQRLVTYTEQQQLRSATQTGYRPELGTIHPAFALQHAFDKHRHANKPLYLCFVDLKSAYDKVQWQLLWSLLQRLGVHGHMLGAVQSLYHGSLLSMRVNGQCGHSQSPSIGLRQGCLLSATLFGIFIDGLHHHLQTTAPAAGVQIQHLKLTDHVYADDICLLAGSPQHLQALIDALVGYCATLHMEISVAKTKVMVVSRSLARLPSLEAAVFTCNGLLVEQVDTFLSWRLVQLLKPCVSIWAAPMTMPCIVPEQPLLLGLLHVHTTIGLDLSVDTGGIVSCLFLVGACSGFYSLGWALINCQLFSGVFLGSACCQSQ